jgi:predicted RNA-binding Zn-ribbon protein involved in translation (DUF1610 family)
MKNRTIQQGCLAVVLGLALLLPAISRAGGNQGQVMGKFAPVKSAAELEQLKAGDTMVKVCRACGAVVLVRVEKPGKGAYDYVSKKCEECGSDDTYVAVAKQVIPFKEQDKR